MGCRHCGAFDFLSTSIDKNPVRSVDKTQSEDNKWIEPSHGTQNVSDGLWRPAPLFYKFL